jgi:hypothetical protein
LAYSGDNSPVFQSTGNNSGTLAVTEGARTISMALLASYIARAFVASSDGHGGTLINDPPPLNKPYLGIHSTREVKAG